MSDPRRGPPDRIRRGSAVRRSVSLRDNPVRGLPENIPPQRRKSGGAEFLCYIIYPSFCPKPARARPTLEVSRLDPSTRFRKEAYAALKRAITAMDIYDHAQEIRLDERRRLSEGLVLAARRPVEPSFPCYSLNLRGEAP